MAALFSPAIGTDIRRNALFFYEGGLARGNLFWRSLTRLSESCQAAESKSCSAVASAPSAKICVKTQIAPATMVRKAHQ